MPQSLKNALQQDLFEANNLPNCEEPSCLHWLSWNETVEHEGTLRFPMRMRRAVTQTFQRGQVLSFVTVMTFYNHPAAFMAVQY